MLEWFSHTKLEEKTNFFNEENMAKGSKSKKAHLGAPRPLISKRMIG